LLSSVSARHHCYPGRRTVVALAAVRGDRTLAQLAEQFDAHPNRSPRGRRSGIRNHERRIARVPLTITAHAAMEGWLVRSTIQGRLLVPGISCKRDYCQYRYSSMQAWNADQILLAINYGSDGICFLGSVTRTKRIPSTGSVTEPDAEANDSLPPLRWGLMWISTHFLVSPAISSAPWQLLIITPSSRANGSPTTVC
jgi:hypothetical protein